MSLVDIEHMVLSKPVEPEEYPVRIIIPTVRIDLYVEESEISDGTWELSETKASFGKGSSYLDEMLGNSVIFAHARRGLFAPLKDVKINDPIVIVGTENIYVYRIAQVEKVKPEEKEKVKSLGDTNLTVFTCDGVYDEYRLVVKAKRVNKYRLSQEGVI